ncbi:bifunctional non-homologous end joining protein LigD [Paenibacillus sp. UNCCL117]|uniref:ATP-dependent DNA ligase n=1 Tax=unclassified Paenibacillus TaxID=185978 RepID=UPI000883A3A7|nr:MULTISPECIES: DNA ligase [unclassified Paenibacillus]SDE30776.1 bifunctional non-homologous end joining protein LigD [Paenibacillus sp. cl123]SFW63022.1 bifunctional non-homologous end joining protein LigD [Paenibacillus sp. UNCCL117]
MHMKPVVPFEPISADRFPEGDNWIAQIKWDGVRMLAYGENSDVRLVNRRLNDRSAQYPELLDASRYCNASSFILDGELIALDPANNRPSFHEIMRRDALRRDSSVERMRSQVPVTYMVFDLLFLDGVWVTDRPLAERQRLLGEALIPQPDVQLVQSFSDPGSLMEVMVRHGMEGVVCKDLSGTYTMGGKDKRWQKRKIMHDLYAVVGGVTYRDKVVNALLLGLYNSQGDLIYIGHAGTGKVSVREWYELTERAAPLIVRQRPFRNVPERSKDAVWLEPRMTVKVQFLEWTGGMTMRHPSIQAFADVPLESCTMDQIRFP